MKLLAISMFMILSFTTGCVIDQNDDSQSTVSEAPMEAPTSADSARAVDSWDRAIQAMQPVGATCSALQTSCTSASSCCSGFCMAGCGHPTQCCAAYRQACQVSADCCGAQACFNGICVRSNC